MELRQALAQVSEIHAHLNRTETFRGYRSATIAFTGLVGLATAAVQTVWLPQPSERLSTYAVSYTHLTLPTNREV